MKKKKALTRISKKEFDSRCPYCGSGNVEKGIISYGIGASSTGKLPDANIEVWHCGVCKKIFELF
jgi:transposase-like protein